MPHYKMVVAYSCWEFPLAGGPDSYRDALAKGVGGCLSNNTDSVSLLFINNNKPLSKMPHYKMTIDYSQWIW
jgi:hypothetical protein